MCGICGIINFNQRPVDKHALEKMNNALIHRGPDSQGYYIKNNVGLGHRRLSIIDLKTGDQPLYNEDKSVCLIFNGEIYNFKGLRAELEKKGHVFLSQGDAEVIVHLYEDHQEKCLDYLRGMFAFAIWDSKKNKIFLARDRLGKKPLVYYHSKESFIFASELNALMQAPGIKKEVDSQALNLYLSFFYVPAPYTIFKNVKKLLPAHYIIIENNKLRIKRYWHLRGQVSSSKKISEYKDGLISHLDEAVRMRLISDVPLGAFLSGGIDSSAIVSRMCKYSAQPVKTFSVGFSNQLYNELAFARIVSKKFQTEHNELVVNPNAIEILPEIIKHYGEPYADHSCIPTYYLAKFAAESVKVVLTGDGGDESFAGYYRYTACQIAEIFDFLPRFMVSLINGFISRLSSGEDMRTINWQLKRFFRSLEYEPQERYLRWISAFDYREKEILYDYDFMQSVNLNQDRDILKHQYFESRGKDFSDTTRGVDIETYLPNDLLVKMDIATMAHSLEARSPFLDHKFMEFAATIPYDLKLRNFRNKYILKQAFKEKLPSEIIKRKKQGFGIPVGEWLRTQLKNFMQEILLDPKTQGRGYFKKENVQAVLDEHAQRRVDNGHKIWALLMLELWHREFIDA